MGKNKRDKSKHSMVLDNILYHPEIINLHNVSIRIKEAKLYYGNRLVSEPDLLLYDSTTEKLYIVEYKSTFSSGSYSKAKKQLRTAEEFIINNLPCIDSLEKRIQKYLIYEKYKYKRL